MKTTIIIVVLIVLAILLKPVLFKKQAIINNVNTVNTEVITATTTDNSNVVASTTKDLTTAKATTTKVTTKVVTGNNATTSNTNGTKLYTLTDIAKHNNSNDCWMAISGNVYDVTRYADSHPGGDAIYKGCGIDATRMYSSVSGHRRSSALNDLKKLLIGNLQS